MDNGNTKQLPDGQNLTVPAVLMKLVRNILGTDLGQSKEQSIIRLLYRIDSTYFTVKFAYNKTYDYEGIIKGITDYYCEKTDEKVKKTFIMKIGYMQKFSDVFQLVLDLAFTTNENEKQRYISEIITLNDREKELLMPYVDEVMKRKFIHQLGDNTDDLLDIKDQEYQQLRESFEELYKNYTELLESNNSLKTINEKLIKDNSQILHQKQELMIELGVHGSSSFFEIAQKYKTDIKYYESELQRLQKQIEQKNSRLKANEEEIKTLFNEVVETGKKLKEQIEASSNREKYEELVLSTSQKEVEMMDELEKVKAKLEKVTNQLNEQEQQNRLLNKYKCKYDQIKESHLGFRKKFMTIVNKS